AVPYADITTTRGRRRGRAGGAGGWRCGRHGREAVRAVRASGGAAGGGGSALGVVAAAVAGRRAGRVVATLPGDAGQQIAGPVRFGVEQPALRRGEPVHELPRIAFGLAADPVQPVLHGAIYLDDPLPGQLAELAGVAGFDAADLACGEPRHVASPFRIT